MQLATCSTCAALPAAYPLRWRTRRRALGPAAGRRSPLPCSTRASSDDGPRPSLDIAAANYARAVNSGMDADEVVAAQLGAEGSKQLSETQQRYRDAIRQKLQQRADELQREKEARAVKFKQGKTAYARGQYPASVALLESALNEEGPLSLLGGEIQLWLALAYQACGREQDCIDTYKIIKKTHPVPAIRRQAGELRYIMEAPKLEISPDERVQIPVLTDLDPNRGGRAPAPRPRPQRQSRPKTWDEQFWENWQPPVYVKNRYVWAAAVVVATGLALWSARLH